MNIELNSPESFSTQSKVIINQDDFHRGSESVQVLNCRKYLINLSTSFL